MIASYISITCATIFSLLEIPENIRSNDAKRLSKQRVSRRKSLKKDLIQSKEELLGKSSLQILHGN
jgi:hypothetical protein